MTAVLNITMALHSFLRRHNIPADGVRLVLEFDQRATRVHPEFARRCMVSDINRASLGDVTIAGGAGGDDVINGITVEFRGRHG